MPRKERRAKVLADRKLVKKGIGSYYLRFLCPPLPATVFHDTGPQTGIPAGRNWQFFMSTQDVWVESTENKARADRTNDEILRTSYCSH